MGSFTKGPLYDSKKLPKCRRLGVHVRIAMLRAPAKVKLLPRWDDPDPWD